MGQRSQIYVRITEKNRNGKISQDMIPMYYHWNYGERMISRVAATVEWLKENAKYYFSENHRAILENILRTNFDMKSCVNTINVFLEAAYEKGLYNNKEELNAFVFDGQDNNDGKAYIDVIVDREKDRTKISYCLTGLDNTKHLTAEEYLNWQVDYGDPDKFSWKDHFKESEFYDDKDIEYTTKNIAILQENATVMSEKAIRGFKEQDYKEALLNRVVDAFKTGIFGDYVTDACIAYVCKTMLEKGERINARQVYKEADKLYEEFRSQKEITSISLYLEEKCAPDQEEENER